METTSESADYLLREYSLSADSKRLALYI